MERREGQQSYIRTPVELDLAFRSLERRLDRTASPLIQFALLTDFLIHTASLPSAWLSSYSRVLFQRLSRLADHVYVSGGDPHRWNAVMDFLDRAQQHDWIPQRELLERVQHAACTKMIYAHVCVRAFRQLHETLCLRRFHLRALPEADWSAVLNADTLGEDAFSQYVQRAVPAGHPVPAPIDEALRRWRHARENAGIGVVLLDQSDLATGSIGTVLRLDMQSRRSLQTHAHFTNDLVSDNTETPRQLERCTVLAADLVRRYFAAPQPREYMMSFHERGATFHGASLGLSAALLMAVDMQQEFNRELRWHLAPHLVCSGELEEDGTVRPAPPDVLRSKVTVVFFSHADRLVIAASQREEALRIVRTLQQQYPARQLDVLGIETLEDCASAEGILRHERRAVSDRILTYSRQHAVLLLTAVLLLLGGYTGFLYWKYYYDYPNLETASGEKILTSSIVYNPRAPVAWMFRDDSIPKPGVMPYGDLEVGDGEFRNVYIYNYGRFPLDLDIAIDGPDAAEWFCSWNGGRQNIASTKHLRIMVMFAPLRPGRRKSARLVLRDADSGEELYALPLRGSAGAPLRAGYAMRLDGYDDMLVFGKRSSVFGMEDAAVEMWIRPDTMRACLYSDTYNPPDGQAMENMAFSLLDDTLAISFASIRARVIIPPGAGVRPGEWMHFAFSYRHPIDDGAGRLTVLINGMVVFDREEDFLIEGIQTPHVTIGAFNNGYTSGGHFRGDVDELRLWRGYRSAEDIRAQMRRRVSGRERRLRGYWDMDQPCEESIFATYKLAQEANPVGRPAPVRSDAPIDPPASPAVSLVEGPRGAPAVEIQPFAYLHCAQQLLSTDSARTYALWYRHDSDLKKVFLALANQDAWALLRDRGLSVTGDEIPAAGVHAGWNHAVLRIDAAGVEYFLNSRRSGRSTRTEFMRGPFYRYYGLQLGFFFDGYNNLRTTYYDSARRELTMPRAVADLCVWERALTEEEITGLLHGATPDRGLVARWPLDTPPDAMGNIPDTQHGYLLHMRRVRGWE